MKKRYQLKIIAFILFCFTSISSYSQTIADGIYLIHSKISGKVVEVANASMANNGNVSIRDFVNQDFQRWFVRGLGNNIYTFTNEGSGKMLHVVNATPADMVNVDQHDNTNDNRVKWKIVSDGAGSYTIQSLANTNFVLDVNGSGTANGTNIQIYTTNNSEAQKFTLELLNTKTVYLIANAHLDTQWDWTVQQTIRVNIKKTLEDNFALIEKYPNYTFNFEGAIHYIWAKEYYPELYEKLKTYIAQGRWHVAGGSMNANDVLVPSTESFFRNVYLGQSFFKNEFNQKSNEIFLPDCFGFGYNFPTIAKHCGLNGFSTQKLSWGSAYGTPFNMGVWQGVDGSQILTALNPGPYDTKLNADVSTNNNILNETNAVGNKSGHYVQFKYYGVGDQGGAPTEESVQWLEKSLSGKGTGPLTIVSGTAGELFNKITPDQYSKFTLYNNELPMKQHGTGCYTSQCAMKLWNRKNELMGKTAEGNAAMANWLGALPYPTQDFNNNWIKVLLNQHHDAITGTSIPEANTNSLNDEVIAQNGFSTILKNAVGATVRSLDTRTTGNAIVVYNPLSIVREDIVEASIAVGTKPAFVRVYDKAGTEIPSQIISFKNGKVTFIFAATVPSLGYEVYDARPSSTGPSFADNLTVSTTSVESAIYKITINAAGDVSSIIDKRYNKELLSSPLRLALMQNNSDFWPSWEIVQESVTAAPIGYVDGPPTITIDEDGPVRVSLKIVREKNNSLYVQKIRLTEKGPKERIDFVTGVDWRTLKALLKATFPLTVSNSKATYDLGLGTIQRSNNSNELWEVYAQEWADLTANDNSYGVSILNDCKYGWDKPSDNTLRLTLIHTPNVTNRYLHQGIQDLGSHQFTYSLYGHNNQLSNTNTHWEAAKLNEPLLSFEAPKHDGFLGKSFSFVSVNNNQIAIKALKKAADSDEIVFRVYELNGKSADNVAVTFNANILAASELNGIEERIGAVGYSGKSLNVNLTAYQPKTFSVSLAAPSQTLTAPVSKPLTLVYDKDVITFDTDRGNGDFDGAGHSYAAELIPAVITADGIAFTMGPKTANANNVMIAKGNTLAIPAGYKKLYILAASSQYQTDITDTFKVNGKPFAFNVQYFSDQVGAWYTPETINGDQVTIQPSIFKTENIGYTGTHRHMRTGDEHYRHTYMFKYCMVLPANATQLTLPNNPNIAIFAITAANNENDDTKAAMELMSIPKDVTATESDLNPINPCGTNVSMKKAATASGQCGNTEAAQYAVDGNANTKWCSTNAGERWLEVDLGKETELCSWYVLHAGSEGTSYITGGFKLQKKVGADWVDVDVVTGNVSNVTKRFVSSFKAQYVRLYITKPEQNDVNGANRIYEFSVSGVTNPCAINYSNLKTSTASGQCGANEAAQYAVDGNKTTKWCANNTGDKWLELDLGKEFKICNWSVLHAGNEAAGLITNDFKLQKKVGNNWVDVDVVKGNTSNETQRYTSPFTAQYVRLYITKGELNNTGGTARIYDFSVSGSEKESITTGILKTDTDEFVNLYPNPVQGSIQLVTTGNRTVQQAELINLQGSILKKYSIDSDQATLDLSSFSSGVYFLKVELDNSTIVLKKIIKE